MWAVAATLPRPLALVGHSFGGLVVRDAVLADPLRADGLAIIASGPAALPEDQQAVLRRFVDVMNAHGLDAVWQAKRAMDAAAGASPSAPDVDAFLTQRFLANSPGSLQVMIETLCTATDQVDALATVAPATTVIVGERDDAWPPHDQRAMAERLGATLVELPDVGHSPAVDAPGRGGRRRRQLVHGQRVSSPPLRGGQITQCLTSGSSAASSPRIPTSTTSSGSPMDAAASSAARCSNRRPPLRQPHHPRVVTEVVVAQVRVPVETELDHDAPMERRRKEVGQQIGTRLLLQQRAVLLGSRVDAVAVRTRQPAIPYRSHTSSSAP